MAESDAALIARSVLGGDNRAFAALLERHQSMVRGLLLRLTGGNASLADDLAQDTFLQVFRSLRGYRGEAKFSSWLYRIAYNQFLMHKRRQLAPGPDFENRYGEECPHPDCAPDRAPDRTIGARIDLERAMTTLKTAERAALTLCFAYGLSHVEAAVVMDMPVGTVKSHIARGRDKLRVRLAPWAKEVAL